MTGLRRTLGLVVALTAFSSPTWAASVDEFQDSFQQGVELLRRGRSDEALAAFQKALASSPTSEQAYALWKETDWETWRELLGEGGEFQLVARRLMELSRVARREHRDDPAAIQALVRDVTTNTDALARRKSLHTLSSEHGEHAVPHLLPFLGTEAGADEDRRVLAMHTLAVMDTDVVPALLAAFASEDAILRRNVALVLGTIGDPRAVGQLLWSAGNDTDTQVRAAAAQSAGQIEHKGDALANFLTLGDDYHHRRDSVMRDQESNDVVWSWTDGKLVGTPVPPFLYNDEMAKQAYMGALRSNPSSVAGLAGVARAHVDEQAKLRTLARAGADISAWQSRLEGASMVVGAAGVEALDLALVWSLQSNDALTGSALCRVLGGMCTTPPPALRAALDSTDGSIRSEAALALGTIAASSNTAAGPAVVAALGDAAGREVLRLAMIIDADVEASRALAAELEKHNMFVSTWNSGAKGLAMAHRAPGLDLVLVAETLPDMTTAQVLDELRAAERYQKLPVLVITKDAEKVAGIYGDGIAGTLPGAADLSAVQGMLETKLEGDRALADDLATRAAQVLAQLAQDGRSDLSSALPALAAVLTNRPDAVAVPAAQALGQAGAPGHGSALLAVVADDARSEPVRVASADALGCMIGREPGSLASEAASQLQAVVASNAPLAVREAAARALGLMELDPATRAELLRQVGMRTGTSG